MASKGLKALCQQYFDTENLYEVLNIDKKAQEKEGKHDWFLSGMLAICMHVLLYWNVCILCDNAYLPHFVINYFVILVKNGYRRMCLKVHPDRVEEDEKEIATEKFKVLAQIHSILSDAQKRKVYDQTGNISYEAC